MKTIKILFLAITMSTYVIGNAQTKDKNIIKVSYSSGCVSEFLSGMLKKQIQDPNELTKMLNMMNKYKVYSSFYQDLETKESVFILDSINKVENLSTSGYTNYVHKDADGVVRGNELFMGKNITFQCNQEDLKWIITEDQKAINGYQCKKAHLENNPKINVWFTPEIPVKSGPNMFYGLPGLVLEADNYFESVNALTISYESKEEFQNKVKEVKQKISNEKEKVIMVKELFAKKENFQRMVEKGK